MRPKSPISQSAALQSFITVTGGQHRTWTWCPVMTEKSKPDINWDLTTWKGSRLQQHREFYALPFARKLEIVEQLCEQARQLAKTPAPNPSSAALNETAQDYGTSQKSVNKPKLSD